MTVTGDSAIESTAGAADPCRRCGHSIRGVADTSACPECGTPARLSRGSATLASADPTWLRRVVFGTQQGFLMFYALPFLSPIVLTNFGFAKESGVYRVVIGGTLLVLSIIAWKGVLAMSTPNPRDSESGSSNVAGTALRVSYATGVGFQAYRVLAREFSQNPPALAIGPLSTAILLLLVAIVLIAYATIASRLALAMPDRHLAAGFRSLRTLVAWSWPLFLLAWLMAKSMSVVVPHLFLLGVGLLVVALPALLFSLVRLVRLDRALTRGMEPFALLPAVGGHELLGRITPDRKAS
ncbi:MAG: hypothetical protein JNL80_04965 [Phycisphaerae bacterium]|jgi:hypothetical protein|nr:hypothetical protein [Phycisphaerae bacterium]